MYRSWCGIRKQEIVCSVEMKWIIAFEFILLWNRFSASRSSNVLYYRYYWNKRYSYLLRPVPTTLYVLLFFGLNGILRPSVAPHGVAFVQFNRTVPKMCPYHIKNNNLTIQIHGTLVNTDVISINK